MQSIDLKGNFCHKASLRRNDFIYHKNAILKCTNKALLIFQDIDNKSTINLEQQQYYRLEVLQIVPIKWTVQQNDVTLRGRELGMGPEYTCKIKGFKEFQELNVISRETSRGKKVDYYVELAQLKDKTYLILNIQIR